MYINGRPVRLIYDSEQCEPYIPFAKVKMWELLKQPVPIMTQAFTLEGDVRIQVSKGTICTIDIRIGPSEYTVNGYEVADDGATATKGQRNARSDKMPYRRSKASSWFYAGYGLQTYGTGDVNVVQYKWPQNPDSGESTTTLADAGVGWATIEYSSANTDGTGEKGVFATQVPVGHFNMFVALPGLPAAIIPRRMTHQYADSFAHQYQMYYVASNKDDPEEKPIDRLRMVIPALLPSGATDAYLVPLFRPGVTIASLKGATTHVFTFGAGNHFHSPYVFVFTPEKWCVFCPALSPKDVDAGVYTAVTLDGGETFTEYSHGNIRASVKGAVTTGLVYGTELNRNIMELSAMAANTMVVTSPTEAVGIAFAHDYEGVSRWHRIYTNDCGASFSVSVVTGFDMPTVDETMIEWMKYLGGGCIMMRATYMGYEAIEESYEATQWPSRYFLSRDNGASWTPIPTPGGVETRADLGDASADTRGPGRFWAVASAAVYETDPETKITRKVYRAFHAALPSDPEAPTSIEWKPGGLIYDRYVAATEGTLVNLSTGEPITQWVFVGGYGLSNNLTYVEDTNNWGGVRMRRVAGKWASHSPATPWQRDADIPPPEVTP